MKRPKKHPFKDKMVGHKFMGRYRLVRRLAIGGMGVIYLARAEGAEGFVKPVVVKLIHPHFESVSEFSNMFIREAQIMSNLQHPGIVNVIDFAKEENTHIMVLEYVSGFELRQWAKFRKFKGSPIPFEAVIQIMTNVLGALDYAHSLKRSDGQPMPVIHRDISPANILINEDGRAKLHDFGIAFVSQASDELATSNTGFKGKLPYSAPELFKGIKASILTDIYSCGVVLHEVLMGKNEFSSRDEQETINRILTRTPASVLSAHPLAPKEIDDVLRKALAKKPEDRYQSADEFRRDLIATSVDDEQGAADLTSIMVAADFGDEMAKYLGVEPLADRERAWRNPSSIPLPVASDLKSTEADSDGQESSLSVHEGSKGSGPERLKTSETGASSPKKLLIGVVAILLLVISIGGVLIFRKTKDTDKQIYLVQSPVSESEKVSVDQPEKPEKQDLEQGPSKDDAKATEGEVKNESPQSGETQAVKKTKPSRGKNNKTVDLAAAFRKRKNDVKNCFKKHAMNLDGHPKILINFEIDETGKVLKSSLSPTSMNGTALGGCLLKVAQSTRFSRRSEPVAFRIPVITWRSETTQ